MVNPKVYGIHGEGRVLCQSCAERLYGNSLEVYLSSGVIQSIRENDRPTYAGKGLLCDDCLSWIFPPSRTEDPWWLVEPDSEEQLTIAFTRLVTALFAFVTPALLTANRSLTIGLFWVPRLPKATELERLKSSLLQGSAPLRLHEGGSSDTDSSIRHESRYTTGDFAGTRR